MWTRGYWVTDGLGFFELLQLAEELGRELSMAVQDGQHRGPGAAGSLRISASAAPRRVVRR